MAAALPTLAHLALTLGGTVLLVAALPLVLELSVLSVAALMPARRCPRGPARGFALAVVVPAHNEQTLIGTCVRSLLQDAAGMEPPVCLYVVAHNCTDRTAQEAAEAGAEVLAFDTPERGKGIALDHAFRHALAAGAGGVLVVDADSVARPGLLPTVAAALAGGADAVQARYLASNADTNTRTRLAALALTGMNVLRPRGRERLGLSCGIFGNGFALSARTLRRVPYTPNSLVEDLEYHLCLVRAGLAVRFLDDAAVLGEMPEGAAASATQHARWDGGRIRMRRQWTLPLLRELLHGRLLALEPLLDLLALPLALGMVLLLGALLCGLADHALSQSPAGTGLWVWAAAALASVPLYVLAAAWLSGSPGTMLRATAEAPLYIFSKLLRRRPGPRQPSATGTPDTWIRTARNADTPHE